MILEGTTSSGAVVPVQVTDDGKVVAEGLTGPQGPQGPEGPEGPPGPASAIWDRNGTVVSPTNTGDTIATDDSAVQLIPGTTGRPLVRDANGHLLVGTASSSTTSTNHIPALQVAGTVSDPAISVSQYRNNKNGGGHLILKHSRGAAPGDEVILDANDDIGTIEFEGSDGESPKSAARIRAVVDGTPAAGTSMPGRLAFFTTPSGSTTPVERLSIDSQGDVVFQGAPIIKSPDGKHWAIEVDNNGNLSAVLTI